MPHPSLDSFFFWNSGSEAVEAAIKMARVFTGRQNVISMQGLSFQDLFVVLFFLLSPRLVSWSYIWRDGSYKE